MTGSWPTIAASRPPGLSWQSRRARHLGDRARQDDDVERAVDRRARPTRRRRSRVAFSTQARFRFSLARRASSGSISTVVTCCALCASSAAM